LQLGSAWTKISKHFLGRTGDMIKNRFYSSLYRKLLPDQRKTFKVTHFKKKKRKRKAKKNYQHINKTSENKQGFNNANIINSLQNVNEINILFQPASLLQTTHQTHFESSQPFKSPSPPKDNSPTGRDITPSLSYDNEQNILQNILNPSSISNHQIPFPQNITITLALLQGYFDYKLMEYNAIELNLLNSMLSRFR